MTALDILTVLVLIIGPADGPQVQVHHPFTSPAACVAALQTETERATVHNMTASGVCLIPGTEA